MFDKMKQIMEMKKQADDLKRELEKLTIEVDEVEGVHIVIDGAQNFKSITLDESLAAGQDKSKLEADILRSVQAAMKKAQAVAAQKMSSMMPGL